MSDIFDEVSELIEKVEQLRKKEKLTKKEQKLIDEVETYKARKAQEAEINKNRDINEYNYELRHEVTKQKLLGDLQNDIFHTELIGELFATEFSKLAKGQRQILECVVEGKTRFEICTIFNIKETSLNTRISEIKKRYLNQLRTRVDNYYEVQQVNEYKTRTNELLRKLLAGKIKCLETSIKLQELIDKSFKLGYMFSNKFKGRRKK